MTTGNMASAGASKNSVSERARERETFKYDCLASSLAIVTDPHQPVPTSNPPSTPDATLTAFAQLGAFRLKTARAFVSLFDRHAQHIVAEATQTTLLAPNAHNEGEKAWLAGMAIPRSFGVCDHTLLGRQRDVPLDPPPPNLPVNVNAAFETTLKETADATAFGPDMTPASLPVTVLPDLAEDERFRERPCILGNEMARFYAGVPLRSKAGINIGVYAVMDCRPRDGLLADEMRFLQDMSGIVMDHLELRRTAELNRRTERMVRGMGNFIEGQATLSSWVLNGNTESFQDRPGTTEGLLNRQQQALRRGSQPSIPHGNGLPSLEHTNAMPHVNTASHGANPSGATTPQDSSQTFQLDAPSQDVANANLVFSKAANIIRESLEVEGVLFLDAALRSFRDLAGHRDGRCGSTPNGRKATSDESSSDDESPSPFLEGTRDEFCNVLAFSTSDSSTLDGDPPSEFSSVPNKLLQKLLRRYPRGRILNYEEDGAAHSSESGSDSKSASSPLASSEIQEFDHDPHAPPLSAKPHSRRKVTASIIRICPGARSVALIPLWDTQRDRWMAGGLIWTKNPTRVFTEQGELNYLRIFGLTTVAEIVRLGIKASEQIKSNIVGSLSHELRSPLHGLVGAVELLNKTGLDTFQENVVYTIETSGKILLDTIDHLLDYSKMSNASQVLRREGSSSREHGRTRRGRGDTDPKPRAVPVRLDLLMEEVVESGMAGYSFEKMSSSQFHDKSSSQRMNGGSGDGKGPVRKGTSHELSKEKLAHVTDDVQVYLDIDPSTSWSFVTHPGAFRRIVMNIFGNSIKYTKSGFIKLELKQEPLSNKQADIGKVTLTISDTGKGISENYLRNHLFTPFRQEDHFSSGTGLGLSLVRQITTSLGGTVNVASEVGRGTTVTVSLQLPRSHETAEMEKNFMHDVKTLTGLRVMLRGFGSTPNQASSPMTDEGPQSQDESQLRLMRRICRDWLHMKVLSGSEEDYARADFVVQCGNDLDNLGIDQLASDVSCPCIITCRSPTDAYYLSRTIKQLRPALVFEFASWPIGPWKLCKALVRSMVRCAERGNSLPAGAASKLSNLTAVATRSMNEAGGNHSKESQAESDLSMTENEPTAEKEPMAENNPSAENEPALHQGTRTAPILTRPDLPATCDTGPEGAVGALVSEKQAEDAKPGDASPIPSDSSQAVLVVDDNAINLKILTAYMSKLKYPHVTAVNGLEAFEKYAENPGDYCCILTDISMPVMDGLEATRRIRALERSKQLDATPIIAITGFGSDDVQEDAYASGVDLFLTRPVSMSRVIEALKSMELA